MYIVQADGIAQLISRPAHPMRLGRRPDRRVGTDQRHPIAQPASPERSVHRPGRPDPQIAVALRGGPGPVGFIYHIEIADAGITAILQQIADQLRTLLHAVLVHRLRRHIHEAAAPITEDHRDGAPRTITQNHVQVLHVRRGIKPAIGQIRANTHHNADDPRRKVIEAFFQPNPVRGRKTAAVAVDVIRIPLHPAPHISVVENPAAKYQRALPDRNGRPRRRRSTGIRTCRRQRQQNGQPPQPTKTKVHRIFHTIGISERLRI